MSTMTLPPSTIAVPQTSMKPPVQAMSQTTTKVTSQSTPPPSGLSKVKYFIYAGIFYILLIIALVVLTWSITMNRRSYECTYQTSITCSNDWHCAATGDTGTHNPCYSDSTYTTQSWSTDGSTDSQVGLPECLYGVNSDVANACVNAAYDPSVTGCTCPLTSMSTNSCLLGCPASLSDVPGCYGQLPSSSS